MIKYNLKSILIRYKINLLALTCLSALVLSSCESEEIELNCSSATIDETIFQGWPVVNTLARVPVISENNYGFRAQTVQSTGVIGLTATRSSGDFVGTNYPLIYSIDGTPQSSGIASFAIDLMGETCNLTIQVNTAGNNNTSASCGATNVHNPNKTYGTLTDQEGNVYKTIVIGNQEWMAENLKTSIYRNGEPIENVTDSIQWVSATTGAWCFFKNDSIYECPYGKLYNYSAVADSRYLCPVGWHVPTNDEWWTLTRFVGGNSVGAKMRSRGLQYWFQPNLDATNQSGFSGLPGGYRKASSGEFKGDGYIGSWWSSYEASPADAFYLYLGYDFGDAWRNFVKKQQGSSVRCLKD